MHLPSDLGLADGTRYALLFTSLVPGGESHLVAFLAVQQGQQGCEDYRRAPQMKQPMDP